MSGSSGSPSNGAALGAVIDVFRNASDALDRSLRHPRLREAVALMQARRFGQAEKLLRDFLDAHPRDASALQLMAGIAWRQERKTDAELLLSQCLQFNPDFIAARFNYASILLKVNKPEAALAEADSAWP